jgi:hypothetical protein
MSPKILFAALAVVAVVGVGVMQMPARADAFAQEEQMRRLHFDCEHNDRRACIRFGILIGEHHEFHGEWRKTHPDWWWWER